MDLNIKLNHNNIHTSVYDTRNDFGYPIVNFPWFSSDVHWLPSYGIYMSQLHLYIYLPSTTWLKLRRKTTHQQQISTCSICSVLQYCFELLF